GRCLCAPLFPQKIHALRNSSHSGFPLMAKVTRRKGEHPLDAPPFLRAGSRRVYWTVISPFMPSARCGVQWNGYLPALMLAKEIVTDSPGFVLSALESSPILSAPVPMFASSCPF